MFCVRFAVSHHNTANREANNPTQWCHTQVPTNKIDYLTIIGSSLPQWSTLGGNSPLGSTCRGARLGYQRRTEFWKMFQLDRPQIRQPKVDPSGPNPLKVDPWCKEQADMLEMPVRALGRPSSSIQCGSCPSWFCVLWWFGGEVQVS